MSLPTTINSRILLSGAVIAAAAALIIGATFAFFSDTETSTGNTFVAGAIDLQIDNESYVTNADGQLVASPETSWELTDLTVEKFFNFTDIKPGDIGEDTISLHVENNECWICAAARVTEDSDVNYTEPELEDDQTVNEGDPAGTDGELAENVNFVFWSDDGDNVFEDDEGEGVFLAGPISGIGEAGQIALADSQNDPLGLEGPVPADTTLYIGKAWCFGTLNPDPEVQDDLGKTDPNTNGPLIRGTGFTCDGADQANNAAQTDNVVGDIEFFAVQSRNNPDFLCSEDYTPSWEEIEL